MVPQAPVATWAWPPAEITDVNKTKTSSAAFMYFFSLEDTDHNCGGAWQSGNYKP